MLKEQGDGPQPGKKVTQSSGRHQQANSDQKMFIPDLHNSSEEVLTKIIKTNFILKKYTFVDRLNSITISSAMEALAGQRHVEF